MAPPRKRRKLSEPCAYSMHAATDMRLFAPEAAVTHTIATAPHEPSFAAARTVPKRIEEIHLQIQQQSVGTEYRDQPKLHRRQLSGIESVVSTIDAAGSTILSTITNAVNSATSVVGTIPTSTAAVGTASSDATSHSTSNSFLPSASASASRNGTAQIAHETELPSTYLATLTNSNIKTVTRLSRPYVTTFPDGQVSTICDRLGQCQISGTSKATKDLKATNVFQTPDSTAQSSAFAAAGGSNPTSPISPSPTATGLSQNDRSDPSAPPPAMIAGGVVGGAAGIAIVLLLAMAFLRYYKRRSQSGHLALPADTSANSRFDHYDFPSQSGMVERAGLAPLVNAMPALFRHQNKSSTEHVAPAERGFTKVSGRKLPSAFSQGMTRDEILNHQPSPTAPLTQSNHSNQDLAGASFYRDSRGFYGGDGAKEVDDMSSSPPDDGNPFADQLPESMTLSPGPQRTPTFHHNPGPYMMASDSPPRRVADYHVYSPPLPPPHKALAPFAGAGRSEPGSLGRSDTPPFGRSETSSIADNRSSRFTEDV